METPKQVAWTFEENTLRKLAIVFIPKTQGEVSVAAKGIQILACGTRDVCTPARRSASEPQECVHHCSGGQVNSRCLIKEGLGLVAVGGVVCLFTFNQFLQTAFPDSGVI